MNEYRHSNALIPQRRDSRHPACAGHRGWGIVGLEPGVALTAFAYLGLLSATPPGFHCAARSEHMHVARALPCLRLDRVSPHLGDMGISKLIKANPG